LDPCSNPCGADSDQLRVGSRLKFGSPPARSAWPSAPKEPLGFRSIPNLRDSSPNLRDSDPKRRDFGRPTEQTFGIFGRFDRRRSHLNLPSTQVHSTRQVRDYPALASIIDRSIHLCRFPATPFALVPCVLSPNLFLPASSLPSLPTHLLPYPFTLPTPCTGSPQPQPQQHWHLTRFDGGDLMVPVSSPLPLSSLLPPC
jgi:hypothetical protein